MITPKRQMSNANYFIKIVTKPLSFYIQSTWLGGYQDGEGKQVFGFDTLKKTLGPHFDLLEDVNMPFFIRETAHKNQWSVAHATVWRKKV